MLLSYDGYTLIEIADKLEALEANNSAKEQFESLETSVAVLQAELKEQLNDLKKITPTWSELNEISKQSLGISRLLCQLRYF